MGVYEVIAVEAVAMIRPSRVICAERLGRVDGFRM